MKKVLLVVLMAVALSSCSTIHVLDNNYLFNHATSTHNPAGVAINNQSFEDEYISIQLLQVLNEGIILTLANNHSSTIRILWDEAAFVDHDGYSHRINHDNSSVSKILFEGRSVTYSGNKVTSSSHGGGAMVVDEYKVQIPSVIPAGARVNTAIIPVDNAAIAMYEPMDFVDKEMAEETLREMQAHPDHPTIKLLLPIEVDGKKIEYTATFMHDFQMYSKESGSVGAVFVPVVLSFMLIVLT